MASSRWFNLAVIISCFLLVIILVVLWAKPLSGSLGSLLVLEKKSEVVREVKPVSGFKLLAFGDLMLDRNVGTKIKNNDPSNLFGNLEKAEIFTGYDMVMANLEGAVTNAGAHYAPQNAYDFAFAPEIIGHLKQYGFTFFSLANNHFSDQGNKGVGETRKNLDQLGFGYSGSIDAAVDENSVTVREINGKSVALIGLSMVYHSFDLKSAEALVVEQKRAGRLVVVNIHWGNEYQHQFNQTQKAVGRGLVDAGADLIIGHHPHVIQGVEVYQGVPIFYSLGNFVFDQYFSADTQQGLALSAEYQENGWLLKLIPLQSVSSVPRPMTETESSVFWPKYLSWSKITTAEMDQLQADGLVVKKEAK